MRPPQSLDDPASLSFADLVKQQQSASSSQTEGRGDLLLAYGSCLLRKFRDKLGDALWGVLETVYLQALEFRQDRWATYCLQALQTRWRDSTRVKRLKGIALEAQGQWAAALCHYDSLLSQQPHDPLTRKRVTAALKNQGRVSECIQMLFLHLDEMATDAEAWQELGTIYASEGRLAQAAFCFEELLVHDPLNTLFLCVYAELQFGLGRFRLSRQYAAHVVSLQPQNSRALWTLILTSRNSLENACADRKGATRERVKKADRDRALNRNGTGAAAAEDELKTLLHLSLGAVRRLAGIYEKALAKGEENDDTPGGPLDSAFGAAALRRLAAHRVFFLSRAKEVNAKVGK
ncbi:tetratricopeptide repeat-containing protein [Toxoplasma gondii GT1]|uniref:ER membrane protein complex subunit 2 n=14 Tax=Toxoplasma gondii TaxID=5811 RepID=B9QP59_TOXGV|nr:tetratricopeptide repeat-containing protein [Toxoplasma gondii GT1]ESS33442.1 tetratricopeptide repeat-containing protein [Toxoplasma gondii VEG]KAF4644030.1 tetratricopeptide repeat-containing protein [Toxoplasma gondii]CEL75644.1 TPA: TPR domain containing protein [Toxoplasma gondii VEG]